MPSQDAQLTVSYRSLDIFGGTGVRFDELVRVDKEAKEASSA
jgi:hypothetical protein